MNRTRHLVFLGCLLLAACTFDAPLAPEPGLAVDEALIGDWAILAEDGDAASGETVIVRRDGDHRYTIEHHDGDSVIHFAGWLGEVGGIRFLQLEVTGDEHGPAEKGEADLFSVMHFEFEDGYLVIRSLNTELVDPDLADTAALQAAFEQHREHPDLFIEPGRLRRL